jgi:DNA-binding CsgD family transcriptional regulator
MKADGQSLRSIASKLNIGYGTTRKLLASIERKTSPPRAAARIAMQGVI